MSSPQKCAAVVVGAGPAGVAVVGNLLEKQLGGKIAWIDPVFRGGRVNRNYREVPSNTKVSLFQAYASAVQPFRAVINSSPIPSPFYTLGKLEPNNTCHLYHAADMVKALTDGVGKMDQVYRCKGMVTAADLAESSSKWTVRVRRQDSHDEFEIITPRLILCTGASPTTASLPISDLNSNIHRLDLDTVLKPSDLVTVLPRNILQTVGVIGASHSAILALLNLVDLARSSHPQLRIKWFTRHALRYAEYKDGWILRDNTGLKGLAADFARQQLEPDTLPTSEAGRYITRIDCSGGPDREAAQFRAHLPECSHVVQAVGFTANPLPDLSRSGVPLETPEFDHETGGFRDGEGRVVNGLFGAGIAFPEKIVDPYGNVEFAVGFFKFMKFVKRVCSGWVTA